MNSNCAGLRRNQWGESSVPGILSPVTVAPSAGPEVAQLEGRLVALAIAGQPAHALQRLLRRARAARPLLDTLYRPRSQNRIPADDVTVCRCEEVSAGDIRRYVDLGCLGPNQTKAFGRCGMGPCQGRQCWSERH